MVRYKYSRKSQQLLPIQAVYKRKLSLERQLVKTRLLEDKVEGEGFAEKESAKISLQKLAE